LPFADSAVVPWKSRADTKALQPAEKGLWQEADEFDRAMQRAGRVNPDPALNAYVQGVMDRLYPEFKGETHVHVLNAQEINAFALPNGSIYVNAGLLARFQNEAQLASVLAHEGAHFTHRHSLQQLDRVQNAAAFAMVGAMLRVPLAGDAVAMSSIFGYSREHETEADEVGFRRLVRAGYDPREAIKTFEQLQAEIVASGIKAPYFFADHPKLQDRIDNFTRLCKDSHGGDIGRERFVLATRGLRMQSLADDLEAFRYKQLILVLADPARRREYPPQASYYLGEAYRLRNDQGDDALAEREYKISIDGAPEFAPAYRALGSLYYGRGDKSQAIPLYRHYLELAPQAMDRGYIEAYLKATP
jgi:Putative Zn-dependent protease, contains TPR repeats